MNTTQRPTPETDAAALKGAYFKDAADYPETKGKQLLHIDDARKLERERDEAREELATMREAIREAFEHLCNVGSGRGCLLGFSLDDAMPDIEAATDKLQPFTTP